MLNHTLEYRIYDGNRVNVSGLDFPGPVTQVYEDENFAIWRIEGGSVWNGKGQTRYAPLELWVLEHRIPHGHFKRAQVTAEEEPGRFVKQRIAALIAQCKEKVNVP